MVVNSTKRAPNLFFCGPTSILHENIAALFSCVWWLGCVSVLARLAALSLGMRMVVPYRHGGDLSLKVDVPELLRCFLHEWHSLG